MKIVIDIPEEEYNEIEPFLNGETIKGGFNLFRALEIIKNGTPLPEGAEILTKEAYSDLCTRAADVPNFESKEYIEQRIENYNKMLKSGILDTIKYSSTTDSDSTTDSTTVEMERKPGKWVDGKCNRCGTLAPFWPMATTYYCSEYCPKCGAKMEVET